MREINGERKNKGELGELRAEREREKFWKEKWGWIRGIESRERERERHFERKNKS